MPQAVIAGDHSGLAAAAVVFALCALGSWLLWSPLAFPAEAVRALAPREACGGVDSGSDIAPLCPALSIAFLLVPSLALLVVAFVFRRTLAAFVGALGRRLPAQSRFLLAPLVASTVFALSWAGSHATSGAEAGLLPHSLFPGVIGLFTVAVARWGQGLMRVLGPLLAVRDHVPTRLRVVALFAVPFGASVALASNLEFGPAMREQLTVVAGLLAGFLFLAPRPVSATAALVGRART